MKEYSKHKPKPSGFKVYSLSLDQSVVNEAQEIHNNLSEFTRDALDYYLVKCRGFVRKEGLNDE